MFDFNYELTKFAQSVSPAMGPLRGAAAFVEVFGSLAVEAAGRQCKYYYSSHVCECVCATLARNRWRQRLRRERN